MTSLRKIFADVVTLPTDLVAKPDGRSKRLKVAKPGSSNSGPTKFEGVTALRPRSRQELLATVERSGPFDAAAAEDGYGSYGARFVFKPDYLRDSGDSDIVDEVNAIGADTFSTTRLTQLLIAPTTVMYTSPKMCQVKHWPDYSAASGVAGVALAVRAHTVSSTFIVYGWRLRTYDANDTNPSYVWENFTSFTGSRDYTNIPSCDVVELKDGSILAMVAYDTYLEFWKSYDGSASWSMISRETVTSRRWYCAIEQIGSRIVAVYAYRVAGVSHTAYSIVSDDGGVTWSDASTIYDIASAPKADEFIDLVLAKNGELYLFEPGSGGQIPDTYGTTDGVNWTNVYGAGVSANIYADSMVQDASGRWLRYCIYYDSGGPYKQLRAYHLESDDSFYDASPAFVQSGGDMLLDSDVAGLDADEVCARSFMDDGFVDVFVIFSDDGSSSTYWMPVIVRCYMWAGVRLGGATNPDVWDRAWAAYAYPSPSDPHPNMQWWTQNQAGTGASLLTGDEYGYLKLTVDAGGASTDELYYEHALPTESYDDGLTARFELKCVSNNAKVRVTLCSDGANSDKDVNFTLVFRTTGEIQIVDENAGSVLQTITPTNWDPTEWNEFVLVCKENEVYLYRAPIDTYREFLHHELVFSEDSLQEDAFAADNDIVEWGIISTGYGDIVDVEVRFRNFMYVTGASYIPSTNWDFDADNVGRRCVSEKALGLMQGISCRWGGIGAVEGDEWELDTGAVYEAENVFIKSPSIKWREPDQDGGTSPAATLTWERSNDAAANAMKYKFNAFALFGRNFKGFTLYGENAGGGGAVTLFDEATTGNAYEWSVLLDSVSGHVLTPTFNAAANDMIPGQYASDSGRKWYVYFHTGALAGRIFKIVDNDESRIFLEANVETLGAANLDSMRIFSDRVAYVFNSEQSYARLRLVIDSVRTSPSEDGFELGHIVIGRTVDVPTDEWEASVERVAYTSRVEGRSGRLSIVQLGGQKRIVKLSYSGVIDRGMFREPVAEFLRSMRDGERPFVWLDDVSYDDAYICYPEPIMVVSSGGCIQSRAAYSRESEHFVAGSYFNRNVLDIKGVVLEEVL